jgi:hypothetical protein
MTFSDHTLKSILRQAFLAVALSACFAFTTKAATLGNTYTIFTGPNVYAPNVIYDAQAKVYKMWYGGWQASGQGNDYIYYRTSSDGIHWPSSYTTVYTPTELQSQYGNGISIRHVNNPSVTKIYNSGISAYQYYMFFTACVQPCSTATDNASWSVVSSDGINWSTPVPTNITFADGSTVATTAGSIVDTNGPSGTIWHLYASVATGSIQSIYLAYVSGFNRQAIQPATPVISLAGHNVGDASLALVGSTWYATFNANNSYGGADVYYATSSNDVTWSAPQALILNNNQAFCSSTTPGILATGGSTFNLYFSLVAKGNPCNLAANQYMQLWQWSIP